MDLDDINSGLASQEIAEKKEMKEIERADDLDLIKDGNETIDYAAEKRLVRKLDFWYGINCCNMITELSANHT